MFRGFAQLGWFSGFFILAACGQSGSDGADGMAGASGSAAGACVTGVCVAGAPSSNAGAGASPGGASSGGAATSGGASTGIREWRRGEWRRGERRERCWDGKRGHGRQRHVRPRHDDHDLGAGYMGMWLGRGATADHWGLAHEFTHAVQAQTKGLACGGDSNFCGWIYESHADWHAHQLPEYRTNVHCSEMLPNAPHLYLGSTRDRYCNWQFLEYLKEKYCYKAVNDIWNAPTTSNDPFTNIAATRGWDTSQLNDFLGE